MKVEHQFLFFGANGFLGRALKEGLSRAFPISSFWEISLSGLNPGAGAENMYKILEEIPTNQMRTIAFYCQGPTETAIPTATHVFFHVELPRLCRKWLSFNCNLETFFTFGTIHEEFAELCEHNSYLTAKRLWRKTDLAQQQATHIQLHTLYGQPLKRNGFQWHMFEAIRCGTPFSMSGGHQIREYHRAEDIADVIVRMLKMPEEERPRFLQLSHGQPISLLNLAQGLFDRFGMSRNLLAGALQTPQSEVMERSWEITKEVFRPRYRDPITELADIFERELKRNMSAELKIWKPNRRFRHGEQRLF